MAAPQLGANAALQQRTLETARFVSNAGTRAGQLNNALAGLPAAFRPSTAVSGNTNLLTVTSFSGQSLPATTVVIDQIAMTQRNVGAAMEVNAPAEAKGTQRFKIELDGKTHEISFSANENMTQRQFQQAMAAAVNNANIGITASVTTSGTAGTLVLETAATGAGDDGNPRFTIQDLEGEAVALTGADETYRHGQNALFSVNGGEQQSSATNNVNLGGGLLVTLVNTSEEGVSISLGQNRTLMQSSVRQVVTQFNALLDAALDNEADRVTRLLIRDMQGAARVGRRSFEEIGIRINAEGRLSIDEARLSAAAENGSLERFFVGTNGRQPNGFIGRLSRIADGVVRSPMRHVSPHAGRLPGFNDVLHVLNNGGNPQQNTGNGASHFDAYLPDDLMSFLFDALR